MLLVTTMLRRFQVRRKMKLSPFYMHLLSLHFSFFSDNEY
ncbi:hypothetical protein CPter291_3774 [Collimonas pratensis]|uniref:Uncharacterized protein n=1 Tax=Collimonas pratensis TaxID=279113 RepID=A0ABM5ZAU1_9BURK|nr:hypothetical protein CPter291_3774 [Collimonas pratensis]